MSYGMLNDGIESQGEAHRSYDKYGKRMWVGTPKRDMSKKDSSMSAGRQAGESKGVSSDTQRSDVGIK